ncbi:MAG TPA: hypothetical protein VFY14_08885 [Streptomyces sp.]|nr:hypothetical protein [Streptomyces sp.]
MRTVKSSLHAGHLDPEPHEESAEAYETYEIFRVVCPDCAQPIALLADEETLPEHALCPTPWNPFGLTVCQGSGRAVDDAEPEGAFRETQEQDAATLLTLPEGLDWRMQPFSHAGGPGTRPMRVPHRRRSHH